MKRTAEMFQWVQDRKIYTKNGNTVIEYETTKKWSEALIDDTKFQLNDRDWDNSGQPNPKSMAI